MYMSEFIPESVLRREKKKKEEKRFKKPQSVC